MQRIVLAYSGSLGTSIAIPWLAEEYGAEVVTLTLDLGQGCELADIRARALALGAARAHVVDAREEFARAGVLAALQSGISCARAGLTAALALPLIAKHLVDIAHIEEAAIVAHAARSNDFQARQDAAVRAIDPALTMVAPARLWKKTPRQLVDEARQRGIPGLVAEEIGRADRTIWGRVLELVSAGEPSSTPARACFQLTRDAARSPDAAAQVEIAFVRGVPFSVNGVEMPLVELVQSLETIAGTHGVGRTDITRPGADGSVRRTITEAPAAHVLDVALADLRGVATSVELAASTPAIRLELFRGDCRVVWRRVAGALTATTTAAEGTRRIEPALIS